MLLGLEASEACLRAATTSKIQTSHIFTLNDQPSSGEADRREEAEMPSVDDVLTTDRDLTNMEAPLEGDSHEKPNTSNHDATAGSDGKHVGDEDVVLEVD